MNIEGLKVIEDALVAHWRNTLAMSRVGTAGKCNFPADRMSTRFEIIWQNCEEKKNMTSEYKSVVKLELLLQFQDISQASLNWGKLRIIPSRWSKFTSEEGGGKPFSLFSSHHNFERFFGSFLNAAKSNGGHPIFFEQFSFSSKMMRERSKFRYLVVLWCCCCAAFITHRERFLRIWVRNFSSSRSFDSNATEGKIHPSWMIERERRKNERAVPGLLLLVQVSFSWVAPDHGDVCYTIFLYTDWTA